jgi:hypothetical protein
MPRAVVMSNFSRAGVGDAHFRQTDFFHVRDRRKVGKGRVEKRDCRSFGPAVTGKNTFIFYSSGRRTHPVNMQGESLCFMLAIILTGGHQKFIGL